MTRKQKRLSLIFGALAVLSVAIGLMLFAFRDSVVFFFTPSEVTAKAIKPGTRLRVGGLVKTGSIEKTGANFVKFVITDGQGDLPVQYQGQLPDLFKEGQGVVAEGKYEGKAEFAADSILAKHDERYMPREVAESLKQKGLWQAQKGATP